MRDLVSKETVVLYQCGKVQKLGINYFYKDQISTN